MRHVAAAALISLIAAPAFPQLPKLVESVEVRVVNVDVVVRDRAGNPIRGLTKDAFELYQDGVQQTITNFYEVDRDTSAPQTQAQNEAVPAELRRRKMLLFVDSASLDPTRKNEVLAAAQRFIGTRMRPDDQTMIVSWRLGVHVITPFTSNKEVLHRGLGELLRTGPAGESSQASIQIVKRDILDLVSRAQQSPVDAPGFYRQAISLVDRHSTQLVQQQEPLLEAMEHILDSMGGLDGKKVFVYVGSYLPDRPGAELYRYAFDVFEPLLLRRGTPDLQMLTGSVGNRTHSLIEEVSRQGAGYGITMYAIDAAHPDNEFTAESADAATPNESYSRDANTLAALKTMADITGGIAVAHTANFDFAFDTVGRDLDSYYSLGYKPTEEGTHRITVKMKNRGYEVRSRETFMMKSTDEQMSDRAIANLYIENLASAWPIEIRTGTPKKDGRAFLLPVEVTIPSTITLLPQEQKLVGGFILYFVLGTRNGSTSTVLRRPQPLAIPPSAEQMLRAKPMKYTTALRINAGESTLSVAIFDQISGATGYARAKIVAR